MTLVEERRRIQHDPITDHTRDVGVENSRWNQMQDVPPVSNVDRVPGVVPALIARDAIAVLRHDINDLSLTLVTPLQTNNCEILAHRVSSDGPGPYRNPYKVK